MYEQFYGLSARPFDLTPNPRFLVLTGGHREALSNLEYAIGNRTGIMLLVGEAGTGKTTIIRAAIERQQSPTHCVHIQNPALTRVEFVQMLAAQFALSDHARASKTEMLLELERLFRRRHASGERTVLIVDEAQSLPLVLLEEIRLLSNIETDNEKLLSIVIAGQPEIAARLSDDSLRQLKQRIALRCELRPLSLHESVTYIASRIAAAGGVPAEVLTREAVTLIHEFARGIPRIINVIADNALLGGFAKGQRRVTRELVREVCRDFDIAGPTPREPLGRRTSGQPVPIHPSPPTPERRPAGAPALLSPRKVGDQRDKPESVERLERSDTVDKPSKESEEPKDSRAFRDGREGKVSWPAAAFSSILGLK
jgi:general secretion pathway protein A